MIAQGSEGTDETTQRVPKPTTHRIVKTIRVLGELLCFIYVLKKIKEIFSIVNVT